MVRMALAAALMVGMVGMVGCGPYTRADAREVTAQKACDWYAACGEIGEGEQFEDRDECLLETENSFNSLWNDESCAEIERENLEVCLRAIEDTQCNNAWDFINTVFNRCSVANVCEG